MFIEPDILGVVMLALFVVFILLGFPIAFTLMAMGVSSTDAESMTTRPPPFPVRLPRSLPPSAS